MVTDATIAKLKWHAGLQEGTNDDVPSIASSTWPRGRLVEAFHGALADCLKVLDSLNLELNSEAPPAVVVPRSVAYSVTEIVRMIRDCQEAARDQTDIAALGRAAWRVETAWSAVLSGDIDDIAKHVEQEEAARFE